MFNPRHACAARVIVVGSVCVCVSKISPMEHLFILKTLSHTQRTTKVKKFVGCVYCIAHAAIVVLVKFLQDS